MPGARALLRPAGRRATGRFLVEGPQAIGAARGRGLLLEVFATETAIRAHPDLLADLPVTEVGERALASLTETVTPQGLVGVAATLTVPLPDVLGAGPGAVAPRLVVVLLDARDPGNAGTVIRTADAAGADAVILADGPDGGSVDPHNGKVVRASAGSVFHLPIVTDVPIGELLVALRGAGLTVLATAGSGAVDLDDLADDVAQDGGLSVPTGWVFGNEAHGLPAAVLAAADRTVRVPVHGHAESLNLATAAAVCLYASSRAQRRAEREKTNERAVGEGRPGGGRTTADG